MATRVASMRSTLSVTTLNIEIAASIDDPVAHTQGKPHA
jgi:hypothetical protein